MPELPEVEVVVRQLRGALSGCRLGRPRILRSGVFERGAGAGPTRLEGRRVRSVGRRGKLLLLHLEGGWVLTIHLRMTGRLELVEKGTPRPPHTHVILPVDDHLELRFVDPRRFGRLCLVAADRLQEVPFLQRLGPEPFDLDPGRLKRRLAARTGTLKGALLDQSLVAGLGNIYVDEILFAARLHPATIANRLRGEETTRLLRTMREVLRRAIAAGGSTIRDYRSMTQASGGYQRWHRIFRREGRACLVCGETVRKIRIAGRGTHFCPRCQPYRRRRSRRLPPSAGLRVAKRGRR